MQKRTPFIKSIVRAGVLTAALSAAAVAAADETTTAPATAAARSAAVAKLNDDGALLYKSRDYRRAVEKFIQAYSIDPDPNLLFNIARSYDALGDVGAAIEKYEAFLTKPGADPQGRQRAEEALRVLRKSALASTASPAGSTASKDSSLEKKDGASAAENGGDKKHGNLPWIVLGTGAAAAGIGGIVYLLGAKDHAKINDSAGYAQPGRVVSMTEAEAKDLVDSGNAKKTIGAVTAGVGVALVATSVVLFVVVAPAGQEKTVAVRMAPRPGGAALAFEGRF